MAEIIALDDRRAAQQRRDTARREQIVEDAIRCHREDVIWKANFALQCEEIASLIMPEFRNTFNFGSYSFPGTKKTQLQVDSTGMHALGRFGAVCDSLLTPRNMTWHGIEPVDGKLLRSRRVRMYCYGLQRLLFRERYLAASNFVGQNHANYLQLGAFGNMGMFVEGIDPSYGVPVGLSHVSVPMCQLYLRQNAQGRIVGVTRWYKLTPAQLVAQFGEENVSEIARTRYEQHSEYPIDVLHRVYLRPRDDFDPERLDHRGMIWASCHIEYHAQHLLREGGYHSFPTAIGRYQQTPTEVYGRSIAMNYLPTFKTLNAMMRTFLKQGHRAVDPVMLTLDDGLASSLNMRPGAVAPGGVNPEGKPLIVPLATGNIQFSEEMMAPLQQLINDGFFFTLFQIAADPRVMSATEVIERVSEKGVFLAPTIGRQEAEYIGPLVERELDVLYQQGIPQRELGPMPPELRETGGSLKVVHTSPLAKAARAGEAAGLVRSMESIGQLVAITGDHSPLDVFDEDEWPRGIAEIQSVPELWMAPQNKIDAKRRARAQQMRMEQQIKMAPAQAAVAKAQASIQGKNQMEGGMPYPPPISSYGMQ